MRLRIQPRFVTIDKLHWPVFLQNASGNPTLSSWH